MLIPRASLSIILLLAVINIASAQAPSITTQPQNRTTQIGQAAVMTVSASGAIPMSYQWYKGGAAIPGATLSSLVWSNPTLSDSATYFVVAANGQGTAQSADATLTVTIPAGGATDFTYSANAQSYVQTAALSPDGKIYIGGGFTQVNGIAMNRVARLNADGTTDTNFLNGLSGANDVVRTLKIQADGRLLAGGLFTNVNGTAHARIVRLLTNGVVDAGFACQISGAVYAIALQTNGQMLVGGSFTNVNGTARTNLARLNTNGTLDATFKAAVGGPTSSWVDSIAVQSDGKPIVCGAYTTLNSVARTNFARLNTDGTLDDSFQGAVVAPFYTINATVSAQVETTGKILLSGSFTNINGFSRHHIARLNSDGSIDADILNGAAGDDSYAGVGVFPQTDGRLLLTGNFLHVNGVARRALARLNSDGTVDDTFQNGMLGNPGQTDSGNYIVGILVLPDSKLFSYGRFTSINGASAAGIVRLWGRQPACVENFSIANDAELNLTIRATPGVTNRLQWRDAVNGADWTDLPVDMVGTDPSSSTNVIISPTGPQGFYRLRELP